MLAAEKKYPIYDNNYYDDYEKSYSEKRKISITTGEKIKLIFTVFGLGAMCIVMIMSSAYTSQIKYNINSINKEIGIVEGEIQNLVVAIERESEIVSIEEKALGMGMIYPSAEQMVFLEDSIREETDFASVLRREAYN